jgi:hypothetical protein
VPLVRRSSVPVLSLPLSLLLHLPLVSLVVYLAAICKAFIPLALASESGEFSMLELARGLRNHHPSRPVRADRLRRRGMSEMNAYSGPI